MVNQETISGIVDRFFFQSTDNGYCVFVLQFSSQSSTIVTGYLPSIQAGHQVSLKGTWVQHAKFGRQFQAESCTTELPTTVLGIQKYLGSGLIKGIGKVYAQKMVAHFGKEILEIIDKSPERLKKIGGIGQKRITLIAEAWQEQKEISSIMIFLQDKDLSPLFATKIYKKYGQESIAILTENPYRLAEEIWGVGFKSADTIAQKLGFEKHSIKRIKAGIIHTITQIIGNGHLYAELSELKKEAVAILELTQSDQDQLLKNALHQLYQEEKIKLITAEEKHFVTLSRYYFSEKGLANRLKGLLEYTSKTTFDIDTIYTQLRNNDNAAVSLNEDQQRAILSCLQNKVSVVTGGPGTGKTTLIKELLSILDQYGVSYRLAAPTGRAAKRIMEGTGRNASTLHRLLEFDVSTMSFKHNEQNVLSLDFLIIDEASMIDTFLAHSLLKALPLKAHIIFIGDIDQLPSVGAGNVLKDLIGSTIIPYVKLTHIFRQARNSLIIVNAHRINRGEFPTLNEPNSKKDFIFLKEEQAENISPILQKLYTQKSRFSVTDSDSIVLAPMNRGAAGTIKLNQDLQEILNPAETDSRVMHGSTLFKVNDRVMQIRNNYDKLVFNGDIGTIQSLHVNDKLVTVLFDKRIVEYTFDELDELVHSFAISIHKSQGSEYNVVIVPIFMQHFMLLQRNLIYTAITRAKKMCIFIGQSKALAIAIKNNKTEKRKTFLKEFLTTDLQCR